MTGGAHAQRPSTPRATGSQSRRKHGRSRRAERLIELAWSFHFIVGDGKIQLVKVCLYTIHLTKCFAPEVGAAHGREPHLASSG
jgi:hypothetical protein